MNKFLLHFLELTRRLKLDGKLTFYTNFDDGVNVRYEWTTNNRHYAYEESFNHYDLEHCLVDVISLFVERANKQIQIKLGAT
jgi:hypothetical protein